MNRSQRTPGVCPARGAQFKYRQRYGVIVVCDGESDQRRVYERLRREGFKLKVVVV